MRIACGITKATVSSSEYVICIAFCTGTMVTRTRLNVTYIDCLISLLSSFEKEVAGLWNTVLQLCVCMCLYVCPHFLHGSPINEAAETITWLYSIKPLTQRRNIITAQFFVLLPVYTNVFLAVGRWCCVHTPSMLWLKWRFISSQTFCVLWWCHGQNPSLCEVIHAGVGAVTAVV